jgi:hypothetical protein
MTVDNVFTFAWLLEAASDGPLLRVVAHRQLPPAATVSAGGAATGRMV